MSNLMPVHSLEMPMDVRPAAICISGWMDTRSPEQRTFIMRSVRSRDTGPEMIVRSMLHRMGFRFALHRGDLPGRPDIVLPKHKAVVFVHGCFWHGHGCAKGHLPKSRLDFWGPKIQRNRNRDAESVKMLKADGWRVLTIWQCQTREQRYPGMRCRAISAQFMADESVAMFELTVQGDAVKVVEERHYKLLPADSLNNKAIRDYSD